MISIIDYDAGNLRSVEKAINYLGFETAVTNDRDIILNSDIVVLPGVGAFGDAMKSIKKNNLDKVIYDCIDKKIPFLGICLGLQLMYEESEESPGIPGLCVFKGKIKRFPKEKGYKIPQMGWNSLNIKKKDGIFKDITDPYVYFVHSYYLDADDKNSVAATCEYNINFDAAVETENIALMQFHPEKSGETGLLMLKNFCRERINT